MKRKLFQASALALCLILLMSCGISNNEKKTKLVGNDRDEHGCIASAGYQWSELLHDCIRPFEKGIRLNPANENQTYAAYLVFNSDSSKVEVFLPKGKKPNPILECQKAITGEVIWTGKNEEELSVRCIKDIWGIYIDNQLHFVK